MRAPARHLSLVIASMLAISTSAATGFVVFQRNNPQAKPGVERDNELRATPIEAAQSQAATLGSKPEIVLQAGITSPQIQVGFSPDGRLLASMGVSGNSIKLWEVATGRLLRQLESNVPSIGSTVKARPFRFSTDGRTVIALADRNIRRWDVETGRELPGTPLQGTRDFMAAILSEDGSVLAASNLNNSGVSVWAASGSQLHSLTLEDREDLAAQDAFALSPDGKLLAMFTKTVKGSRKGVDSTQQVCVFETASGRKVQTLKVSSGPVQYGAAEELASLAFSSDGAWLGLREQTSMKIWEAQSGRELKSFVPPNMFGAGTSDPRFNTFASKFIFSPDRRLISFVSEGRKISTIDASAGNMLFTLVGHTGPIVSVTFSNDGKRIATSSSDNQIKLWDAANGNEVASLSGAAMPVQDIAFSSDGKSLIVAGQQAIESWELRTDGVRRAVSLSDDYATPKRNGIQERGVVLSRDGRFAIAGSSTQPAAKMWEVATGRELPVVSLTPGKELQGAAFSSDGGAVAIIENDNRTPRSQSAAQGPAAAPSQPIVMPDMSKIMEQMRKDPKKMQEQMKKAEDAMKKGDLNAGISLLETMGVTPAGNTAGRSSNGIRILDVASGRQLQSIPITATFLNQMTANTIMSSASVSFSPDGRVLASASGFNAPIILRDAATGQELRTLKAPFSMSVYGLAWSADGKRLASAHWGMKGNVTDPNAAQDFSFDDLNFQIKIWDAQSGTELNSLAGHNNFVNGLAFSRDGRLLASGSYDSTIKIWDLSTGRELRTLRGHTGSISAIDFSPDGRFIVSGSDDGSARLWSVSTGELLATLVSLNKGEDWLVVTPGGLFDGSPGGWNQILWRFSSRLSDVSPVEIFFNEYYHPGLLPDILSGKKTAAADISQKDRRQPKVSIEAGNGQTAAPGASRELNVRVNVTDAPAGAQDVRLFRNGLLVKVWRGDVLKGQPSASLDATISIVAGPNRLTAYAFNRDNVKSGDASLAVSGADSLKRAATLHLLVMGVNEYSNSDYNLKYATADARAFAEEVERQQRKLGGFSTIEVTSLLDRDATKANLLYALARIAGSSVSKAPETVPAELQRIKAAGPEDAVVVYYAGHGTAQDQRFYLIPHDLGYKGGRNELDEAGLKIILSHSISDLELEQAFEGIDAGHLLMVIDACNSGQALEAEEKRRGPMNSKGLAQLAYEKGMYILTAAQSYQAAMEAEQLGHGYLTYALVEEGLKSGAADDQPKDGQVVVREWLDYATDRVPRMQEAKMKEGRGLKHQVAFVEGEDKVDDVDRRSLQRPRVFYRRELESQPLVVAKP